MMLVAENVGRWRSRTANPSPQVTRAIRLAVIAWIFRLLSTLIRIALAGADGRGAGGGGGAACGSRCRGVMYMNFVSLGSRTASKSKSLIFAASGGEETY